ncbi:acetylxylan esterase [Candidatus Saccharibacteria bacterium]|nr:acetylxylan esterase [Candidatus Saccharibacteria bacterium]
MKTIIYIDGQNFLYKAAEVLIAKGLISDKQELYALDIKSII